MKQIEKFKILIELEAEIYTPITEGKSIENSLKKEIVDSLKPTGLKMESIEISPKG